MWHWPFGMFKEQHKKKTNLFPMFILPASRSGTSRATLCNWTLVPRVLPFIKSSSTCFNPAILSSVKTFHYMQTYVPTFIMMCCLISLSHPTSGILRTAILYLYILFLPWFYVTYNIHALFTSFVQVALAYLVFFKSHHLQLNAGTVSSLFIPISFFILLLYLFRSAISF